MSVCRSGHFPVSSYLFSKYHHYHLMFFDYVFAMYEIGCETFGIDLYTLNLTEACLYWFYECAYKDEN